MTSSLDPTIIYYTHSRIRPVFTGCTTRVLDTLDEIRTGKTKIKDIPQIQVLENDGNYFSLNNRRLYVLKQLRNEGFLENNEVSVRIRKCTNKEIDRYTSIKCSLIATIMKENHFGIEYNNDSNNEDRLKEDMDELKVKSNTEEIIIETNPTSVTENFKCDKLVTTINNNDMKKNLHATVTKGLKNLIGKNKGKKGLSPKVMSQLDEWMNDGLILDSKQRDYIESLLL